MTETTHRQMLCVCENRGYPTYYCSSRGIHPTNPHCTRFMVPLGPFHCVSMGMVLFHRSSSSRPHNLICLGYWDRQRQTLPDYLGVGVKFRTWSSISHLGMKRVGIAGHRRAKIYLSRMTVILIFFRLGTLA
eukprot:scaffold1325_cov138-Amphora_coffeaeformis.AAC.12